MFDIGISMYTFVYMRIELQIKSPTLQIAVFLKAEAMPALLKIIEDHQLTELTEGAHFPISTIGRGRPRRHAEPSPGRFHNTPDLSEGLSPMAQAISNALGKLTPKEVLAKTHPVTFPEKFIVVIGWLEAKRGRRPIRPEVQAAFAKWPLDPSGNPARDFRSATVQGWIAKTGREVGLTEAGWRKLGEMLGTNSGDDDDGAAAPVVA